MAERKKVQKINPRQKPKTGAAGRPKSKPNPVKSSAKAPKAGGAKPTTAPRKPRPATEQIAMTASHPTGKTAPAKKNAASSGRASTQRSAHSATRPPRSTDRPASQHGKATAPLRPVKRPDHAPGPNLSVVLGNKLKAQRKRLITYVGTLAVIGAIVAFCVSSPTGPFERITNSFAVLGGGDYPAAISGTGVRALRQDNGKSFVLSNSHLCGYNAAGKEFLNIQHNFSNPVLEVSHERTLVYNRESTGFLIANNSDILFEQNLEFPIYTADIADNGSVAFATKSSGYAAQVQVFARGMKQKFTWYLVEGLISDVTLSENGKYLAVSVLKVKDGNFSSQVYCFRINKEEPLFTLEQNGASVVALETVSADRFAYLSKDALTFVDWKTGAETKADSDGRAPTFFRVGAAGTFGVFGEAAQSLIVKYDRKGRSLKQVEYHGLLDDIAVSDDYVYILRGNQIIVLDWQGDELGSILLDQKPFYLAAMKQSVYSVDNLSLYMHRYQPDAASAAQKKS